MPISEYALDFLCKEHRRAILSLGHAMSKPNVKQEELDNLQRKIDMLDWLYQLANTQEVCV